LTAKRYNHSVKLLGAEKKHKKSFTHNYFTANVSKCDRGYRLGWQLVEVTAAFVTPYNNAVNGNKLAANPSFSATA